MEDYKIEKKEDLEIITERFNRLNNEYNNKNEYIFNQIKNDFDNILNFNEKDVFEIINKVIKDIDIVKNNINSLYKKLDEYNGYKKACEETINNLVYFYNSHKNLLSKIMPIFKLSMNSKTSNLINSFLLYFMLQLGGKLNNIIFHYLFFPFKILINL